jgi:hypothetical protein
MIRPEHKPAMPIDMDEIIVKASGGLYDKFIELISSTNLDKR